MILDVQDLSFRYSKNAKPIFHNVNLQMEKGEILTILGANGAGKSTLLNCLANILEPYSGKILVNGASIHDMSLKKAAQLIGYVPQNHAPVYDYSVRDFIVMGRAPHLGMLEKPSENDYAIVDEVIRELGIEKLADKAYTQISGGERQQALIGRAIAQQPEIIMFDEPTNHLDYGNQLRMVHKIKNLSKKDYTVIMTTHMPDHAMMIGGKTAILGRDGTLKVGKTEEPVKIDSSVTSYTILDNNKILYKKAGNDTLYINDKKGNKEKIASDVNYFYLDSDQKNIVWSESNGDGTINVCQQDVALKKEKKTLAKDVDSFYASSDLKYVVVQEQDTLYMVENFGEKQKIAIIRQVVQDGQVMIFDEPTSAMDESGKKQFLQLIDQIKNHKIIIIVSHDNAILNTCDEILIL